jgi:hypothetical protein
MKTKSTNTRAKKKKQKNRIIATKLVIIIIPIVIFLYLISVNFLFDQEFNYHYDIGGEKDYLFPENRISEKYDDQRDLTGHMVYFEVNIPRGSKKVIIETKFKSNLPEGENLRLGARDKEEWNYVWHSIYTQKDEKNEWQIINTTFNIKEENLKVRDGKLSFVFHAPYLYKEEYKNYTIPIDYINITVYKPALI